MYLVLGLHLRLLLRDLDEPLVLLLEALLQPRHRLHLVVAGGSHPVDERLHVGDAVAGVADAIRQSLDLLPLKLIKQGEANPNPSTSMLHFELRRKVASWQILQRSGAIVRARQNGLRAAHFVDTVLLVPEKKSPKITNWPIIQ